MEFDRKDIPMNKMVVTSLESKFTVFDLRTQHPTKGFASLTEKVESAIFVPTESHFLVYFLLGFILYNKLLLLTFADTKVVHSLVCATPSTE